jgi:hypothetical protein
MGSTSPAGLPDELVRALAPLRALVHGPRNSVLPIVGSGLSSGALPSWWRLLDDLIGEAEPDLQPELRELLAKDRYLDVASLLEDSAAGKARVLTYMKRTFARPAAPPPSIYADVAALPVDHFATTNYDPWLKDAVARARSLAPRVYVPSDEAAFADLAASSDPLVLMLHGDAARPSTCVLSQRAYRKLQFLPAYRAGMAALAAHRTLLFIGHSLSDPDLLAVLAEWGELVGGPVTTPRHYFLGVGLDRATRLRLAELGVTPIEYGAKGDHRLLPAVLTHLAAPVTAPAAPPSTPRVAARPRVLLAGPHFGLPTVVRQTLEANKDWSAEQIRAYLTDQPELHRAHLAAILRYDLIVDASPWQGFRRWLSVGFRDLEEVLTPGFAPRDPPDATVMFLHDDAKSALETRLLDLRARFPELGARLLASAGEGLASAGVDAATRKSLKSVFDLLGGPREIAAPKAGDLVTPTAADYLRAVRVVAGQVRLPGDTDYRPLEDVFVELSLYRESPAARPPREGKPETKLEAKPDAKLEAKPDPAGETLADSGDDERALREAEARPTPEPAARVDAKGLLVAAPRAYLEGAAGTGKSTLVRWQAVLAAQAARTSAERWPLWIELSQLRTAGDLHAALLDAAFAALHLAPSGPARAELSERLSDGRVVLLLDALDEATTAARNLVVTQVVAKFPTSSLLLSSRPTEAADAVAAALMKVRLTGLTPAGTSDFLRVYFGERPWREEFLAALAGLPGGERWRETPLLLALAATHVAAGRRLPRHTLTLYDEVIDRLLERARRAAVGAAPEFTSRQAREASSRRWRRGVVVADPRVRPRVAIARRRAAERPRRATCSAPPACSSGPRLIAFRAPDPRRVPRRLWRRARREAEPGECSDGDPRLSRAGRPRGDPRAPRPHPLPRRRGHPDRPGPRRRGDLDRRPGRRHARSRPSPAARAPPRLDLRRRRRGGLRSRPGQRSRGAHRPRDVPALGAVQRRRAADGAGRRASPPRPRGGSRTTRGAPSRRFTAQRGRLASTPTCWDGPSAHPGPSHPRREATCPG